MCEERGGGALVLATPFIATYIAREIKIIRHKNLSYTISLTYNYMYTSYFIAWSFVKIGIHSSATTGSSICKESNEPQGYYRHFQNARIGKEEK